MRSFRRQILGTTAVAAAVALVVSGCAGSGKAAQSSTSTAIANGSNAGAPPASGSAPGSGATAGGAVKQGGALTIQGDAGNPTLVENFNPFVPTELGGTRLIYEPLSIASTVDGSFTQFLASSQKFTSPKTLQFTLRDGVKWSDGKPFSAADVTFTFNLLKKYPALDTTGVWSQLSGVAASGNTVTATFKSANVPFESTVAQVPIVPEHLWSSGLPADPTKFANTKPVGTGPFTLSNFAPTSYTLKKNADYWNAAKIAPSQVNYPAQSSNQSTNQLDVASGKFDWSYNFLPNVQQTYISRGANRSYWFPPGGTIGLFLNLTKQPYSDPNFRQGISHLLDRDTIAKKAVNGYLGAASTTGLILPNLAKWLDPSIPDKGMVSQDAKSAADYFAKAGYTKSNGQLTKNGKQATLTITLPNNYSDWVAAAGELKTELAAGGINVTLDEPSSAQYTTKIQAGNFDGAFGGFGGTGVPYNDFNNALNSSFAAPIGTATVNNFERFKSPQVDAALADLAAATDESTQKAATYKIEQQMYQTLPIIPLYYGGSWGLFQTSHFTGWPSANDPYTLPTPYNQMVLLVVSHLKAVG
ncbi:MAG: ABC transporter substrate-binding protein [Nakamurella sp.]